jgi:hypothetical protein
LELVNFLEFDNFARQTPSRPTIGQLIRLVGLASLTLSDN